MAEYTVTFARSARKELSALDPLLVERIFSKIEALSRHPRPTGARKLSGNKNLWRIRVGEYRVVYAISDNEKWVDIITIRHRKDVYRS